MTGVRFRLATTALRGGKPETHVSSVVLSEEEAAEHLRAEMILHLMAGWHVTVKTDGTVICRKYEKRREIRAVAFGPMDDVNLAPTSE